MDAMDVGGIMKRSLTVTLIVILLPMALWADGNDVGTEERPSRPVLSLPSAKTACEETPVCEVHPQNTSTGPGYYVVYRYLNTNSVIRKIFFDFQAQALKYVGQLRKDKACI